jgi:predicted XRE-type DNA-binding protein
MSAHKDLELDLKRQLARALCDIMHGWTQWNAAAMLDTDQAFISNLRAGNLDDISSSRLIRMIARSGHNIDVDLRAYKRFKRGLKPSVTVVRYNLYGLRVADYGPLHLGPAQPKPRSSALKP